MSDPSARIDPSTLGDFTCPRCRESFLALFLYLEHTRRKHGERLAPLAPGLAQTGASE
jgi:hypothetical protein